MTVKGRWASVWWRWRVLPAGDVGEVVDVGCGRLCEFCWASLLHALSQCHSLARVERALHLALLAHFAPHAIGAILCATVVVPFALGTGWLVDISQWSGCTSEHSPDGRLSPAGPAPIAQTTRRPASPRRPMLFAAPPARAFCPASSRAVPRPSVLLMSSSSLSLFSSLALACSQRSQYPRTCAIPWNCSMSSLLPLPSN